MREVSVHETRRPVVGLRWPRDASIHDEEVTMSLDSDGNFVVKCDGRTKCKKKLKSKFLPATLAIFGCSSTHVVIESSSSVPPAPGSVAAIAADAVKAEAAAAGAAAACPAAAATATAAAVDKFPVKFSGSSLRGATVSKHGKKMHVDDGPTVVGCNKFVVPRADVIAASEGFAVAAAAAAAAAAAGSDTAAATAAAKEVQSMSITFTSSGNNSWMACAVPMSMIRDHSDRLQWCKEPKRPVFNCDVTGLRWPRDDTLHGKKVTVSLDSNGVFTVVCEGSVKCRKLVDQEHLPMTIGIFGYDGGDFVLLKSTAVPVGAQPLPPVPLTEEQLRKREARQGDDDDDDDSGDRAAASASASGPRFDGPSARVAVTWDERICNDKMTFDNEAKVAKCTWGPTAAVTTRAVCLPGAPAIAHGCRSMRITFRGEGNSSWDVAAIADRVVGRDETRNRDPDSSTPVEGFVRIPRNRFDNNLHGRTATVTIDGATRTLAVFVNRRRVFKRRIQRETFPLRFAWIGFNGGSCTIESATAEVDPSTVSFKDTLPDNKLETEHLGGGGRGSDSDSDDETVASSDDLNGRGDGRGGGSDDAGPHHDGDDLPIESSGAKAGEFPVSDAESASDDDDDDDGSSSTSSSSGSGSGSDAEGSEDGEEGADGGGDGNDANRFKIVMTTGSALLLEKPEKFKELLEDMTRPDHEGGVVVVDEVYQLQPATNQAGALIANLMMHHMWQSRDKLSIIACGYENEVDKFVSFNPGMRGRFSHTFKFRDYHEGELHELYFMFVQRLGGGQFRVAPGHEQAVAILARRMAKGAQQKGFDNARLVHRNVEAAMTRCLRRLLPSVTASAGAAADASSATASASASASAASAAAAPVATAGPIVKHLLWQDILGVCPIAKLKKDYKPLRQLQAMVGFPGIKHRLVRVLVNIVRTMAAELAGERVEDVFLNQLIYGNPGTGKTTVATIYAQCLADLGITAKADLLIEYPTNLKGVAVGEAERNIQQMMERARDKVLLIDEFYQIMDDTPHSAAMIEALVSEIAPVASFRPVIIGCGYRERMLEALSKASNPGLQRRIAPNPALEFEGGDFTEADLSLVLRHKLRTLGSGAFAAAATAAAGRDDPMPRRVVEHAVKLLLLDKQRPNFGNGGAVEALALNALRSMQSAGRCWLVEADFGALPATEDPAASSVLLQGSPLGQWFDKKREQVRRCQQRGVPPVLPTVYAFTGPSGSGKKTEARALARLLHSLQVLGGTNVREVSVSALIGKYVGQSTPKLLQLMREQLGGMVLVTNAGRLLANDFGLEVVRELFDAAGRAEFAQKVVVALIMRPDEHEQMCEHEPAARSAELFEYGRPTAPGCVDIAVRYLQSRQLYVDPAGTTHRWLRGAFQLIIDSYATTGHGEQFGGFRIARELVELCDRDLGATWGSEAAVRGVAVGLCHKTYQATARALVNQTTTTSSSSASGSNTLLLKQQPSAVPSYGDGIVSITKRPIGGGGGATESQSNTAATLRRVVEVRTQAAPPPPPVAAEAAVATAAAEPVVVEQLALLLEEAVQLGVVSEHVAADIAQNHNFDKGDDDPDADATDGLPEEIASFLRRKGLDDAAMKKESKSMRDRMKEARKRGEEICPICMLPEAPALKIGCPWSFKR